MDLEGAAVLDNATRRVPDVHARAAGTASRRILHDHFPAFAQSYDSLYAQDYGKFRLERISYVEERFETCGDYTKGCAVTD